MHGQKNIKLLHYHLKGDRTMVQAVGHRSYTAEVRFRPQTVVRGICVWQSVALGQCSSRILQFFAVSIMPPCFILVYHHHWCVLCIT